MKQSKVLIICFMVFAGQIGSDVVRATDAAPPYQASASFSCHHDPKSALPCAGTGLPEPRDVDAFWQNMIAMVVEGHGYVTPQQVQRSLGISFSSVHRDADGHLVVKYEGNQRVVPLSIQLDGYPANRKLMGWERAQGEPVRAYSVLNIAGGDLGCVPLQKAQKLLTDKGFVLQGSISYPMSNTYKSRSEFVERHGSAALVVYYDNGAITMPCVESIKVVGLK
ncbi:hypothetical protein [Dyella nitratireducens]|uniref:Uncharacterized protein n=1 Tax=Dyella nitratireducens TaxID=1849580 RepID=A0ABQ1GRK9_9GAMM|nr:hypothetical protein [Dyella nitratireducens]GGA48603.1 hypothetical protein GCM10010981_42330 [Dyella nitratireducens]GLQ42290.1 hypothetical protein GCM10007902_21400 [Dyella nitratireducens]